MTTFNSLISSAGNRISLFTVSENELIELRPTTEGTKILLLGNLEAQPDVSQWEALIGQFDKVFLHGEKAYQLFMPPYILIAGAIKKTTYCPLVVYMDETVAKYAEAKLQKNTVSIWIHDKLKI